MGMNPVSVPGCPLRCTSASKACSRGAEARLRKAINEGEVVQWPPAVAKFSTRPRDCVDHVPDFVRRGIPGNASVLDTMRGHA